MKRSLLVALLASLLLHVLFVTAPGWQLGDLLPDEQGPIEARLVARMAPKVEAPPAPRKSKPRRKPKPAPPPRLVPPPAPEPTAAEAPAEPEAPPAPEAEPPSADTPSEHAPEVATEPAVEPELAAAPVIPDVAPNLPRRGRIVYTVSRGRSGFTIGRATNEWQHDGRHYRITATAETTGIAALFKSVKAVQTSEGKFEQGELRPERFHFDRGNGEVNSARFDWPAQQVTFGDGQVVSIAEGAEDFLSMFYQLAQAAQRGEGIVMAVATGKKVERYAFEWLGEETLSLPFGAVPAWHVRAQSAAGGKDFTEVWLAKDMAGLPLKIRNTDRKGEVYEQTAEAIDYESE